MGKDTDLHDQIREAAERSLVNFIKLVSPDQVLGQVHERLCSWWERPNSKSHQLVLLPREHRKSAMMAFRVAWYLTKFPWLRFYYVSSTVNLAEKQLSFIKQILTNDNYRKYWPDMVEKQESKRTKWSNTEITVDHPLRKAENVRDPSIFIGGLTTERTGMHCDIAALDDVVVQENAYSAEGRNKVESLYSLMASIETADAKEWVAGTIYNPNDLYSQMMKMRFDTYDELGNVIDTAPLYEVFMGQVEDKGDGTGVFLWPREKRADGKWFGFDNNILAKKKAQYLDRLQFRAQYYNDPNDPDSMRVDRSKFQYFDRGNLVRKGGNWYYKEERLNVFAAIDFAFSLTKRADYTALAVVGVSSKGDYYILDIDRFKTDKISEYYAHILDMHSRWQFKKLAAEVTVAQATIVKDLKDNYIKPNGMVLSIEEMRPMGNKEERIAAVLEPRYDNLQIWHYEGGHCQNLEDEIMLERPPHDDIKDAVSNAISISVMPTQSSRRIVEREKPAYHSRFGGITY